MWILVGALGLSILIMFITNHNLKGELDFYKKKAIDINFRVNGNFRNRLSVSRALEREFASKKERRNENGRTTV